MKQVTPPEILGAHHQLSYLLESSEDLEPADRALLQAACERLAAMSQALTARLAREAAALMPRHG